MVLNTLKVKTRKLKIRGSVTGPLFEAGGGRNSAVLPNSGGGGEVGLDCVLLMEDCLLEIAASPDPASGTCGALAISAEMRSSLVHTDSSSGVTAKLM